MRRETSSEFLRVICEAHDWAHEVMRLSDWLSVQSILVDDGVLKR